MDNQKLIERIKKFQASERMNHFMCVSCKKPLIGVERNDTVILVCETCTYTRSLYSKLIEAIVHFTD